MPKILVVDDEEGIRRVLVEFLAKMGFEIIQASGGEEAIELLRPGLEMDLMVIDMKMPKVGGLEVLKEKKNLNDVRPVIILTGSIDAEEYYSSGLKELGLGPGDVIYKPVDLFSLLDTVKKKLHMAIE
ncbi:MAG: response regulator [Candidatus Omnitrophota bacterium]